MDELYTVHTDSDHMVCADAADAHAEAVRVSRERPGAVIRVRGGDGTDRVYIDGVRYDRFRSFTNGRQS